MNPNDPEYISHKTEGALDAIMRDVLFSPRESSFRRSGKPRFGLELVAIAAFLYMVGAIPLPNHDPQARFVWIFFSFLILFFWGWDIYKARKERERIISLGSESDCDFGGRKNQRKPMRIR